jgi:hypothetical protein
MAIDTRVARFQMERIGYTDINERTATLFSMVGQRVYYKIIEAAYRYARVEAWYLNMSPKTSAFQALCEERRKNCIDTVLEKMFNDEGAPKKLADFKPLTDYEMMQCVHDRYTALLKTAKTKKVCK